MRTSLTHPLEIATVPVPGGAGAIGVTFCPGKKDAHSRSGPWDRDLAADVAAIRAWGARIVVTLVEAHELELLHVPGLGAEVRRQGLEWLHLPIRDVQPPGRSFEAGWRRAGPELRARLAAGGRVLVHCRGGLGRAGTVAARLLVECGMDAEAAIAAVRAARPGAIETRAQEEHVRRVAEARGPAATTAATTGPLSRSERVLGCLLAGATGDALGAPVEFSSLTEIRRRYGSGGIRHLDSAYGRVGAITDDTQMTLFTAEGLICARRDGGDPLPAIHAAYRRWLRTQSGRPSAAEGDGLLAHAALWNRRAPGNTCLSALRAGGPLGGFARNDSKGCGGVMRVAPIGFIGEPRAAFVLAAAAARLTHGHPSGYLPAGALAMMIGVLAEGSTLPAAVDAALAELASHPGHTETSALLARAATLAGTGVPSAEAVESLGAGWVGHEALAIAVYAALAAGTLEEALVLAVNHSGDSDSTGAVAGNLLGALRGPTAIPARWLDELALRVLVEEVADALSAEIFREATCTSGWRDSART